MAFLLVLPALLPALVTRCGCDSTGGYNYNYASGASQFGNLLKPPPPPPLSNIVPVPFHGGTGRIQRQNNEGYVYQPPQISFPHPGQPSEFKFPAPFYKQYNFNFVPPPQPFTTTPSPTLFQKVSGWLFPSQQTAYEAATSIPNNIAPLKKDCNPCNLVPWIPVIRYNLDGKSVSQNAISTYGPPSPTAQNVLQYRPQQFYSSQVRPPQLSPAVPLLNLNPPIQQTTNLVQSPSSTYGPPSPTHTIGHQSQNPLSSTYSMPSVSYGISSSSVSQPSSSYGLPSSSYGSLSSPYNTPSSMYTDHASTYSPSTVGHETFLPSHENSRPEQISYTTAISDHETVAYNQRPLQTDNIENGRLSNSQLPKVSHPVGFTNSYGEPISNVYRYDIPYPSATAAESSKVNTEVLPYNSTILPSVNGSFALSNPAPFTLNKSRHIHTLQPVALPNLSVSPLPPIFNARPFRTFTGSKLSTNFLKGMNYMQQTLKNVDIQPSVPISEFTHSVEYPISVIQSPVIDIDSSKNLNLTKTYRNIPDKFLVDNIKDISSQASEDHISAQKNASDSSFETTGADVGNDIYETRTPLDFKLNSHVPSNHKYSFADLRGVKDEDVDKYRTENNLQNIDSPLLYLKPSAPHKDFGNFAFPSTTLNTNEYEIYDDIPTTIAPYLPTHIWNVNGVKESLIPAPEAQGDANKPKIVQIIIPYLTSQQYVENNIKESTSSEWDSSSEEYQARKVPAKTESVFNSVPEHYNTISTTTEEPSTTTEEYYHTSRINTAAILNDLYDVKEPPFDIIKLQHNIDDWTEQEYSNQFKSPQKFLSNTQYAKKIPDEYLTTTSAVPSYITTTNNYEHNEDEFDHEGSSSIQYSVRNIENETINKRPRNYKTIERSKNKNNKITEKNTDENRKLHIYTAATSFRTSTTTTAAPWGKIQTSISPLTKEKVYVVTSKPWKDISNKTGDWYEEQPFESKKTNVDNNAEDIFSFKSPRFSNRPSFEFTSSGISDSVKSDSSYAFSKNWHQRINELDSQNSNSKSLPEGSEQNHNRDSEEITTSVTSEQ